jgi:hypothetical protein
MRLGSPATYECRKSKRAGMHKWARVMGGKITTKEAWERHASREARCMFCGLTIEGEDAADVFRGAPTPIGQVRLPASHPDPKEERP